VHAGARIAGQQSVAATIDSSAALGHPEAEPGRRRPSCVDAPTVTWLSACWAISTQSRWRFQGAAHHQRVVHADAVVGEHRTCAGTGGHHAHLGELGSARPDGDRTDRVHVDQADCWPAMPDVVGDHRAVGDWGGVRHRENRGSRLKPRPQNRFQCLGIFTAGSRRWVCRSTSRVAAPDRWHR